jgi:hypothetical protein
MSKLTLCAISPEEKVAKVLELDEINYEVIKKELGGDFRVLQIPGLKEENIDVFALSMVPKDSVPSLVVVNESVTPPVISDAVLGKIILAGVDESNNTVPLNQRQIKFLVNHKDFIAVGDLHGGITDEVLAFKTK